MSGVKGFILDSEEIEVVVPHDPDEEITSSHFFPGYDDPKMVRAVNELNGNQLLYTKRGKPKENSSAAGQKFYRTMCLRTERVYVRGEDGEPVPIAHDEGWQRRIPPHVQVAAASAFISKRGDIKGN